MIKKTKGQIEDAIAKEFAKFYAQTLGIGPKTSRCYILHDMIIIRLKTKLSMVEEHLLKTEQGIELVKDIRDSLHEAQENQLINIVKKITGRKIVSSHNDISTKTGEILQVFILDKNIEDLLEYINDNTSRLRE